MVFIGEDIGRDEAFKRAIAATAKFRVTDRCTNPLFTSKDVSLQKVKQRWALVIQLNSNSAYLQHEVNDQCNDRSYIPRTQVSLQLYTDTNQCCKSTDDLETCIRDGCQVKALDTAWGNRQMAYKMILTGNSFEFKLDKFILDGTKFTSPTKTNFLTLGSDVNDGDVSNAVEAAGTTVLLEMESVKADFEHFKQNAKGDWKGLDAKALFGGVQVRKGKFHFNCQDNKALCECLTATGVSKDTVEFKDPEHSFKLVGNGDFLGYEWLQKGGKRRRLLQRRKQGC